MTIKMSHVLDHRSLMLAYLPAENSLRETLVLPGAGCTIGCCSTSCGAAKRK